MAVFDQRAWLFWASVHIHRRVLATLDDDDSASFHCRNYLTHRDRTSDCLDCKIKRVLIEKLSAVRVKDDEIAVSSGNHHSSCEFSNSIVSIDKTRTSLRTALCANL